jgi:ADP-dependent NAD(P)H-hydrate dehydratase / NAD(P)H-hydrate epimerase
MRRAGDLAAAIIRERVAPGEGRRALVCCGPGNNGGDGWVVAAALARHGFAVFVQQSDDPRTPDARAARAEALATASRVEVGVPTGPVDVAVDAILGTGSRGQLRGDVARLADEIAAAGRAGALVASLDLPTGLDASTGETVSHALHADLTVTFGTIKRGQLLARSQCGEIVVVDIGLGPHAQLADGAPLLLDAEWVRRRVPPILAEAHKGVRRRVLIVGGDRGMAGAAGLAARGALRSGVGMVRLCVHAESRPPLQASVAEATIIDWPHGEPADDAVSWPHALLIGPGLGAGAAGRERVEQWLKAWTGPVVLDADALNAFAGDEAALGDLLDGRPAIVTPHPLEFARLIGVDVDTVLAERFEIGARLARALHAVVLLKGVPTVITAPDGEACVSASGTPALGAAGSGDVLAGIAVTLLAQTGDPFSAAACAAFVHGRAGEVANAGRTVRGVTLDDVLGALSLAWPGAAVAAAAGRSRDHAVLATLPRVGDA